MPTTTVPLTQAKPRPASTPRAQGKQASMAPVKTKTTSVPRSQHLADDSSSQRKHWLLAISALLAGGLLFAYWPAKKLVLPGPPAMSSPEITACPETQVIARVTSDLRLKVAGVPSRMSKWRSMPLPAKHVLALSWVEDDLPPGAPTHAFQGFSALLAVQAPNMASLDDIAQAYEAIGAPKVAEVIALAKAMSERPAAEDAVAHTAGPLDLHEKRRRENPFAEIDQQFREQRRSDNIIGLLRAYIRAHGDALAETSGP